MFIERLLSRDAFTPAHIARIIALAKRVHLIFIVIDVPLISKIDIFSVYFYTSYFPVRTVIKLYSGTFVFIVV